MAVDVKKLFNEELPAALAKNAEDAKTIGAKYQMNITGEGEWAIDVTQAGPSCKAGTDATADCTQQLQRLMPKNFMAATPWPQLQHYARYLKAITLRLDKYRADPARDAQRLTELKPQEQRYWRLVAERKGAVDDRMLEFRWLLEELRVSFFAQELRTPQPVSIKRLEKAWGQLNN